MTAYAIAQYLPREARERACRAAYVRPADRWHGPTTEYGDCPMGVATHGGTPTPTTLTAWLWSRRRRGQAEYDAIMAAAAAFIWRWDRRRIGPADLPRVLGIEP